MPARRDAGGCRAPVEDDADETDADGRADGDDGDDD
jgi:hypothetical protein